MYVDRVELFSLSKFLKTLATFCSETRAEKLFSMKTKFSKNIVYSHFFFELSTQLSRKGMENVSDCNMRLVVPDYCPFISMNQCVPTLFDRGLILKSSDSHF